MEEAFEEQTHVVKGKRTKRQRPQSPVSVSVPAHSSIFAGNNPDSPPASSAEFPNTASPETATVPTPTEEEEDLANCLILLAQGNSRENPVPEPEMGFKFRSKRFVETPAGTGGFPGKAGIYVYQCKTCDRTFPSFQALGGHRASHKRTEDKANTRPRPLTIMSSDEDSDDQLKFKSINHHKALFGNNNNNSNSPKFSGGFKVHECSICGAEFMSGQALGGHMRRHRPIPGGANTTLALSQLTPTGFDSDEQLREAKRRKIADTVSLDLDLNLAPSQAQPSTPDHHNDEHKRKQSHLVLSNAPTLVDCHY